jgi:hypothetical protein
LPGIILGGGCLLLVVGGSILAAILFPVFAQAREKARQTACLSNIKQMGMASLMYAQDYDNKLPARAAKVDGPAQTYTGYGKSCTTVRPSRRVATEGDPSRPYGYAMDSRLYGIVRGFSGLMERR